MATTGSRRARQALDAAIYALAVATVVFLAGAAIGVVLGGGLVTAKFVMFLVGLALFGYGAFRMRPDPPWDTESTDDGDVRVVRNDPDPVVAGDRDQSESRFQAALHRVPPLSRYSLPPGDRLSTGSKLFLASIAVLAWSYVMETVFGVAA